MFLVGKYNHQIDAKNRLRIPFKLRPQLGEGFYLVKGGNGCLNVFSKEQFNKVTENIANLPISDLKNLKAIRAFMASVQEADEDNQGRFTLDSELKAFAAVDKDVVFIGMGNRIELWSKERWDAYNSGVTAPDDFDSIFERLAELGV